MQYKNNEIPLSQHRESKEKVVRNQLDQFTRTSMTWNSEKKSRNHSLWRELVRMNIYNCVKTK